MTVTCQSVLPHDSNRASFSQRVAIVIPAFNEAAHLHALIARCRAVRPAAILVVDDTSTDATPVVLARAAEPRVGEAPLAVLRNRTNLGKQGSVRRALRALRGVNVDAVALIDGDGQHDPAELPALASLLDGGFDLVIGARSREQMPLQRQLSNWLVNLGFRWLAGVDFVDVQSGLRIYHKALADVLAERLPAAGGYALEHESLSVLACHAQERAIQLRVAAAPIACAYGEAESGIRLPHILQLAGDTVRHALRLRELAAARPLLQGGV